PISRRELCLSASALIGREPPIRRFGRARGCSSAGRAPALQAGGHRFDPGQLHHYRSSLRQAESKRSQILVAVEHGSAGVLLRLFFCSLTIWNDPSIEVEYGFNIRRTVFFICPRLFGVIWSSE